MTDKKENNTLIKSEEMIASIISYLVPNGVKRVEIDIDSLEIENLQSSDLALFIDAMQWLIAENIIRHTDADLSGMYYQCCITSYGFALLGQKFVDAKENETVGKAVKNVSEDNASYANIGNLLGGLLGAFTKSISS
jgi:hypothetical protein